MQSHVQECCDWPATHERLEAPATQHTTVKKLKSIRESWFSRLKLETGYLLRIQLVQMDFFLSLRHFAGSTGPSALPSSINDPFLIIMIH